MKLFNHTKIDDKILERVLYRAAKAVGSVRTQKVVVKVTTASSKLSGTAQRIHGFLYRGYLEKRGKHEHGCWIGRAAQAVYTDGGYIRLRIPLWATHGSTYYDPLLFAEEIYRVAAHEWRHIRDYQKLAHFGQYNRNWKKRPHERRAVNSAKKALREKDKREDIQDAVITLGIEIERLRAEKGLDS